MDTERGDKMKIQTVEYFCDICGKKFDGQCEIVKVSSSGQDYSGVYVGGITLEYKEVCNDCTHKITSFIYDLMPQKDSQ
jgi:DNA-directed RNA polymerase subunit RPC12/RpoP